MNAYCSPQWPHRQTSPFPSPSTSLLGSTMLINLVTLPIVPRRTLDEPLGSGEVPTSSFPQEPQTSCDQWPCSCPQSGTEDPRMSPFTLVPGDSCPACSFPASLRPDPRKQILDQCHLLQEAALVYSFLGPRWRTLPCGHRVLGVGQGAWHDTQVPSMCC